SSQTSSCARSAALSGLPNHRSVVNRLSASNRPSGLNARHFTPPVLKSQPVITLPYGTQRSGSAMRGGFRDSESVVQLAMPTLYRAGGRGSILVASRPPPPGLAPAERMFGN